MCCGVLGVVALAAAGRRSMDSGCGCRRERFEPRTNVIRMTEPSCCCGCGCGCCCCNCCGCGCGCENTSEQSAAASVSCEAVEAFKQAYAGRSCGSDRDNHRSCGCR